MPGRDGKPKARATAKQSRQTHLQATKTNGQANTPPRHQKRQETPKERLKTARARESDSTNADSGNKLPQTSPPQPPQATNGRTDDRHTDSNGTRHTATDKGATVDG